MQVNVYYFGIFSDKIAKKIGLPESSPMLFSVARYNYPMQFLGCKSKYFVVCFYGCLLLASLCLVLSIPLLVAQSNPFITIKSTLVVLTRPARQQPRVLQPLHRFLARPNVSVFRVLLVEMPVYDNRVLNTFYSTSYNNKLILMTVHLLVAFRDDLMCVASANNHGQSCQLQFHARQ